MKTVMFWVALLAFAVLCPASWMVVSVTSQPAWVGEGITANLPALRAVFSVGLVAMLISTLRQRSGSKAVGTQ